MPLRTVTTLAACLAVVTPASATPTMIDAAFLADLPSPAAAPTLCMVDTGLTLGVGLDAPVPVRTSVVGTDASDAIPMGHGSLVASAARTMFPALHLVSVRVASADGSISWDDAARGVTACLRDGAPGPRIITIAAEGNGDLGGSPLAEAVSRARELDANVVVAAGNTGGAPAALAHLPGVVAVGAVNSEGRSCATSARGPGIIAASACPVRVLAPDGHMVSVTGTSFAVPQVAAVLAAIRAYAPDLTASDAQGILAASTRRGDDLTVVNARSAFRAAGLAALLPRAPKPLAPPRVMRRRTSPTAVAVTLSAPPAGARLVVRGSHVRPVGPNRVLAVRLATARTVRVRFVHAGRPLGTWRSIRIPARPAKGRA